MPSGMVSLFGKHIVKHALLCALAAHRTACCALTLRAPAHHAGCAAHNAALYNAQRHGIWKSDIASNSGRQEKRRAGGR